MLKLIVDFLENTELCIYKGKAGNKNIKICQRLKIFLILCPYCLKKSRSLEFSNIRYDREKTKDGASIAEMQNFIQGSSIRLIKIIAKQDMIIIAKAGRITFVQYLVIANVVARFTNKFRTYNNIIFITIVIVMTE